LTFHFSLVVFFNVYLDLHSFSKLDPDPDPHSLKKLDPDPHKGSAAPKHWSPDRKKSK
jgi:hypothetical protein